MSQPQEVSEVEYRRRIQATLDRVERAFENVDPDLAECEQTLGSLSVRFQDQTRLILSSQPSVRQLWLAIASQGMAYHFNYDAATQTWIDDKGRGVELLAFLNAYFRERIGADFAIA